MNDGRFLRFIGSSVGGGGAGGGAPSTRNAAAANTLAFASLASNNLSSGSTASWWNNRRSRTSAESVANAYRARAASLFDSAWPRSSTRTSAASGGFSSFRASRGSASARAASALTSENMSSDVADVLSKARANAAPQPASD